ncbi:MAG: hypothetical protein WDW38_009333 [Sanguina aurantia]
MMMLRATIIVLVSLFALGDALPAAEVDLGRRALLSTAVPDVALSQIVTACSMTGCTVFTESLTVTINDQLQSASKINAPVLVTLTLNAVSTTYAYLNVLAPIVLATSGPASVSGLMFYSPIAPAVLITSLSAASVFVKAGAAAAVTIKAPMSNCTSAYAPSMATANIFSPKATNVRPVPTGTAGTEEEPREEEAAAAATTEEGVQDLNWADEAEEEAKAAADNVAVEPASTDAATAPPTNTSTPPRTVSEYEQLLKGMHADKASTAEAAAQSLLQEVTAAASERNSFKILIDNLKALHAKELTVKDVRIATSASETDALKQQITEMADNGEVTEVEFIQALKHANGKVAGLEAEAVKLGAKKAVPPDDDDLTLSMKNGILFHREHEADLVQKARQVGIARKGLEGELDRHLLKLGNGEQVPAYHDYNHVHSAPTFSADMAASLHAGGNNRGGSNRLGGGSSSGGGYQGNGGGFQNGGGGGHQGNGSGAFQNGGGGGNYGNGGGGYPNGGGANYHNGSGGGGGGARPAAGVPPGPPSMPNTKDVLYDFKMRSKTTNTVEYKEVLEAYMVHVKAHQVCIACGGFGDVANPTKDPAKGTYNFQVPKHQVKDCALRNAKDAWVLLPEPALRKG